MSSDMRIKTPLNGSTGNVRHNLIKWGGPHHEDRQAVVPKVHQE